MKCLVCHQNINYGEDIFGGSQGVCLGEADWSFSNVGEGLSGVIHLYCLKSLSEGVTAPNMEASKSVDESVVTRSDALSILME